MAAVDVAFKLTCATLFATALASGAWLTASMVKGYNDAQEYQVREVERVDGERSKSGHDDDRAERPLFSDLEHSFLFQNKKLRSEHTPRPPKKRNRPQQPRRCESR